MRFTILQRLITNSQYSILCFYHFFFLSCTHFSLIMLIKEERKRSSQVKFDEIKSWSSEIIHRIFHILKISENTSFFSGFQQKELAIVKTLLSLKLPCKSIREGKCWPRMQWTSLVRDPTAAGNLNSSVICDKNESNQHFFSLKNKTKPEAMTCKFIASLSPSVQKESSIC